MSTTENPKSILIVFDWFEAASLALDCEIRGLVPHIEYAIPDHLFNYVVSSGFDYVLLHCVQFNHLGELLKLSTDKTKKVIVVPTSSASQELQQMYNVLTQVGIIVMKRPTEQSIYFTAFLGSTRE